MLKGPIVYPLSTKDPDSIVVFIHGYGASGDDLIDLSKAWQSDLPNTLFISPHASEPCEMNLLGYQWFGLTDFNPYNIRSGIDRAGPILKNYLEHISQEHNVPFERMALVGFSQGTMMALEMMFHLPQIGAILGYSGAFYPPIQPKNSPATTKVLLVHGTLDTVVSYVALDEAIKQLKKFNINAESITCEGIGHTIDELGVEQGGHFLKDYFNQPPSVIHL